MANEMKAIQTINITSATNTITFTAIPQTYTDLKIVLSGRSSVGNRQSSCKIIFNSVTSSNYYMRDLRFNGTTSSTSGNSASTGFSPIYLPASSSLINTFSVTKIEILNYKTSNKKIFRVDVAQEDNVTSKQLQLQSGLWDNTSAITSISIIEDESGNFVQNTTATLYGVSSA